MQKIQIVFFFLSVDGHCGPLAQSIMKMEMVLKTGKRKTVTLYLLQHKVKYAYLKCLFSCIWVWILYTVWPQQNEENDVDRFLLTLEKAIKINTFWKTQNLIQ